VNLNKIMPVIFNLFIALCIIMLAGVYYDVSKKAVPKASCPPAIKTQLQTAFETSYHLVYV